MKRLLVLSSVAVLFAVIFACSKTDSNAVEQVISQQVRDQIRTLGFNSGDVVAHDGGYIVEGDIFLTAENLQKGHNHEQYHNLIVGESEQYRTFNLVNAPRLITVSSSGNVTTNISSAIDIAIDRYNAANLQLTFQRVASGGDIDITVVNGGSFIASAGFPTGGNPYNQVQFNRQYRNWNVNTLASVFAHEMGHCIGFRHTDYMNRSYSCGTGGNEGQETTGVGAVHIAGTPTGPDPNSWMLACIGNGVNRPFNGNDLTALGVLY